MTDNPLSEFKRLDIENSIATDLSEPRDSCRLMVLDKNKNTITGKYFYHLSEYLKPGDCIILNKSRVWKAKLTGHKNTGGKIEILLISTVNGNQKLWHALSKKPFLKAFFKENIEAKYIKKTEDGSFVIEFSEPVTLDYLDKFGEVPLPQYIINARKKGNRLLFQNNDIENYQTVYAQASGSIAAPTAGLHFTGDLLNKLKDSGVNIAFITLHIGWGTFKPVRTGPDKHKMLEEICSIDEETAKTINDCKRNKKRIVAVGTSVMRALETFANADGRNSASGAQGAGSYANGRNSASGAQGAGSYANGSLEHGQRFAGIFIYPGYKFRIADAFLTNFHVPDSAPLYMTAAFAGKEFLLDAYKQAIKEKYRFYSYGDAMMII